MLLAGPECSLQPLGRLYDKWVPGTLIGFNVPYEQALVPRENIGEEDEERPKFPKEKKRDIICKMCPSVERVHAKGIVQGATLNPRISSSVLLERLNAATGA